MSDTYDAAIGDKMALFGGSKIQGDGLMVQDARFVVAFGGLTLDLRHAHLNGDAFFDCYTLFGGIELRVPAGWRVVLDMQSFFGGCDMTGAAPQVADSSPTLHIKGISLFGGVEVERF